MTVHFSGRKKQAKKRTVFFLGEKGLGENDGTFFREKKAGKKELYFSW